MNPPPPPAPPTADKLLLDTLQQISVVVGGIAAAMALYLYLYGVSRLDAVAPVMIFLFMVCGWLLLRAGRLRQAILLGIGGVLMAGTVATIAYGSVRSAGVMLFACAVVGAGVFASLRVTLATGVLAIGLITALSWAEWLALLVPRGKSVGATTVATYAACIAVLALMVYYSRRRNELAMTRLKAELENRQRTERERDRSLDRFVRIFRNSPNPMLAQSARDGMILDVNPAFERCYGYTREQVLGRNDTCLWHDQQQRLDYLHALMEHRRTEQVPALGVRADGSPFDVLVSSELSTDPGDRLVITSLVDVTTQKAALEQLRKSEERFAKAFNFSPLNMTITRLSDGQVLEINRATDLLHGHDPRALQGRTTQDVGLWANAEERAAFVDALQRNGHVRGYETRVRHRDGQLLEARLWAEKIDIDGEECILSCAIDVSEEKRREKQLLALTRGMAGPSGDALFRALTLHMAQVLEADKVSVGELQDDGEIMTLAVWKDGASAPNHRYTPGGTPCGATLAQAGLCLFERDLPQHFPGCGLIAQEGLQAYVGQSLQDETGRPIGLLAALWRQPAEMDNDRRALMAIFASRANAELVRLRKDREILRLNSSLEVRVRERTAELQKLNAELDSFAYSVSHDLKSPLRAIDGFTQVLQESLGDRLDEGERAVFGRILAATQRMGKLIGDLLDLARVSQGELRRSTVNLSAWAQEFLQREQERQPARALRWRIEPDLLVQADPRLARIALENLLNNAVKYTRDQPDALIELGQWPATPQRHHEFFLRDNGSGFDMAHADRLFQPFQRLHPPDSGFEGTGIGLATVRRILERHGGHIRAHAHPGTGAEFSFSFDPSSPMPASAPAATTVPTS